MNRLHAVMKQSILASIALSAALYTGCSAAPGESAADQAASAQTGAGVVPASKHVWILTEENYSYEHVIGNSAMPYFNQLAKKYALASEYYADQHSSLPALMWIVAGAPIEPNNDTTSCQHSEDNVVRELLKQGYKWRAYQENMPSPGYQGLYGGVGNTYYRRHNPLIDFTDVCPGTGQENNSVPYTQLAVDFANNYDTNFAYVTPDASDDLHSGPAQVADAWLANKVPAILARPEFQANGDGLMFITFDEADLGSDNRCSSTVSQGCGGHIATLVIGPRVTPGFVSTTNYKHENLLKTVCVAMGLSACPGAAQNAAPMSDFFGGGGGTSGVTISTPGNGATVANPVHLIASASESVPVAQVQVWDNGTKLGWYPGSSVDQTYTLPVGSHTTTVIDLDASNNVLHSAKVTYDVQIPATGVTIVSPTSGETLTASNPVHVVASASESVSIGQMQVWDNGNKLGSFPGATVNQYFNLAAGPHTTTVLDLDTSNNVLHKSTVSYTVSAACSAPVISDPTAKQIVGAAIDLQAAGPGCIVAMEAYIDSNPTAVAKVNGNRFPSPTWVPVTVGTHTLNVNGWDGSGQVYVGQPITFTR